MKVINHKLRMFSLTSMFRTIALTKDNMTAKSVIMLASVISTFTPAAFAINNDKYLPETGLWFTQGDSVVNRIYFVQQNDNRKLKLVGYVGISSVSAYRSGVDYAQFTVDLQEYTTGDWVGWMGGHGFISVDFPKAKLTCQTPISVVLRSVGKDDAKNNIYILKAWTPEAIAVETSGSKCPSDSRVTELTESWPMTYFRYR